MWDKGGGNREVGMGRLLVVFYKDKACEVATHAFYFVVRAIVILLIIVASHSCAEKLLAAGYVGWVNSPFRGWGGWVCQKQ
jgi:hypothetical protein